jgi:hypothetical protein
MSQIFRSSWFVIALLGAGCNSASAPPFPAPPEMVLGTGLFRFAPILPCERLPIVHGVQGWYHVWGSVRIRYMNPKKIHLDFTLFDPASGMQLADAPTLVNLDPILVDDGGLHVAPAPNAGTDTCATGGDTPDLANFADPGVPDGRDGWGEALGNLMLMPHSITNDGGVINVTGVPLRARVDAQDADGRTCSDEKTFVAFTPAQ